MIDRGFIARSWSQNVVPVHPVPERLFDHQMDAMFLLMKGENVFLGETTLHFIIDMHFHIL